MSIYSLRAILDALTTPKGNKRMIFDFSAIGGFGSKNLKILFVLLPFIEYAAIFNPYVFNKLGIAQAIIFFIIFLVFIMQLVFGMIWFNNKKLKNRITESWAEYFPDVELKLVLAGGSSPYRDFFTHYQALSRDLDEEQLHSALKDAFVRMQEENAELLEAMKTDRSV